MTGWVMLGLEAAGRNPLDVREGGETPVSYLREQGARLRSTGDLERTILALEAAGHRPAPLRRHRSGRRAARTPRRRRLGRRPDQPDHLLRARDARGGRRCREALASGELAASRSVRRRRLGLSAPRPERPGLDRRGLQALAAAGPGGGVGRRRAALSAPGAAARRRVGALDQRRRQLAVDRVGDAGADRGAARAGGELSDASRYLDSQREPDGHFRYSATSDQTPIWVTAQVLLAIEREPFPLRPSPARRDRRTSGRVARRGNHRASNPVRTAGAPSETQARGGSSATEESERSAAERNAREGRDRGRGLSERRTAAGEGRPDAVAAAAEPVPPAPFIDKSPPETAPAEDGESRAAWPIAAGDRRRRAIDRRRLALAPPPARLTPPASIGTLVPHGGTKVRNRSRWRRCGATLGARWTSRPRSAPAGPTRPTDESRSIARSSIELLELARWAPNHHLTNPWRFRVVGPQALERLKQAAGPEAAIEARPRPDADRLLGGARRRRDRRTPRTCTRPRFAAYIVLLAAHARGLVGYWRTPEVLRTAEGAAAVGLEPDERFVALIHLGHPVQEKPAPEREPADAVVTYLD